MKRIEPENADVRSLLAIYKLLVILTGVGTGLAFYSFMPGSGIIWWLAGISLTIASCLIFPRPLLFYIIAVFYGDRLDEINAGAADTLKKINEAADGEDEVVENEIQLTITKLPEDPIARYLDADIWEWMEFTDVNGVLRKATFEGTIEIREGQPYSIPDGCFLLPPGVVYRFEPLPG